MNKEKNCREIQQNEKNQRSRQENWRYQGNISCKDGHDKGQKQKGPNGNREIKKMWKEYTELYKKDVNDPDNHNGVITHLEPDILECEVKWSLGSTTTNKATGVMEFQLSYLKF